MARVLAAHAAIARGAFAVVVLLSFAILFAPGSDVPPSPAGVDKLVHGGLFLGLALTGRWAGMRRGVLAVLLPLYAAASELIQAIPALHRDATLADWLADVVGALVGLLVWELLERRPPR
ncbi:MAG: VanZ family protein [Frankiales bacterium]|nr:VanZ family protein [Frankiales bacterium]